MYFGDGQNEIKKTFKYIVIIRNVFYMLHVKVPNLARCMENNKLIIIIQNGKSTNKIINNLGTYCGDGHIQII